MGSPNFDYLRPDWPELGAFADDYAYSDPRSALVKLRNFAEQLVDFVYYHHGLRPLYQANLLDLLNDSTLRQAVPDVIQTKLHQLRVKGNKAAHGERVDAQTACQMVRVGYDLGRWLVLSYGRRDADSLPSFREPSPASGGQESRKQVQREKKAVLERFAALEAKYRQQKHGAPRLASNPFLTETQRGEQWGFVSLRKGLYGTVRSPLAHVPNVDWGMSERDALDILTMIALVHGKFDQAYRFRL